MGKIEKLILLFCFIALTTNAAERLLFVAFPYYLIDKNFSAMQIGVVFSVASLFLVFSRIFFGKISDKYGRKFIMSSGLFLSSLAMFLYPFAQKLIQFISLKSVEEISSTLVNSVKTAIHADVFSKKIRARAMSRITSSIRIGRLVGMIIGLFVVTFISLRFSFFFASVFTFLAFLSFSLFYKEKRRKYQKIKIKLRKRYSPTFLSLVFISFILSITFTMAHYPAFFILAKNYLFISPQLLYLLLIVTYVGSAIAAWKGSKVIKNIGIKKVIYLGLVIFSLLTILYPFSRNVMDFLIVMLSISAVYAVWYIAFKVALMNETRLEVRGEQIGLYSMIEASGNMIGPLIGGFLIDTISIAAPFIVSGIVGVCGALIYGFVAKK